jgi:acyl-CoA reductase-like NAD-dependent aldehyde dehydrogenase
MFDVPLLVAGREVPASQGATFERRNPVTGEVASRAAAATPSDAAAAAASAQEAFPAWSALGPSARRAVLLKAADLLEARTGEVIARMVAETGCTPSWGGFNAFLAAGMLRDAAALTTQVGGEVIPSDRPNTLLFTIRQPAGVVLGIAPWNAPIILGVRAVASPLACGNAVVLKSSETCPATHRLIGEVLRDAGLPPGTLNVVSSAPADAPPVVQALIAHPAVRRVNFTGSSRVGRAVAEAAATHFKPVLLELGGKAPVVVLDDADLDQAVAATAFSAFANQGQICMSAERVVVDEAVADAFVDRLATKARSLPAGDPRREGMVLGSLVSPEAARRLAALVADAVGKGARCVAGGPPEGTIMPATVLDHVTPDMKLYGEESFGPVVCVVRVRGVEEAVRVANDTEFGLSSSVFGRDVMRALAVARRLEASMCHVNGPTVHDEAQMPFGGMKASGNGRFGGRAALDEFTELRTFTVATGPLPYPF